MCFVILILRVFPLFRPNYFHMFLKTILLLIGNHSTSLPLGSLDLYLVILKKKKNWLS